MRRCHLALLPLPATAFAAAFAAFTPAIGFVAHHSLGVERGRQMPALRLNGRECAARLLHPRVWTALPPSCRSLIRWRSPDRLLLGLELRALASHGERRLLGAEEVAQMVDSV